MTNKGNHFDGWMDGCMMDDNKLDNNGWTRTSNWVDDDGSFEREVGVGVALLPVIP